jgi:hypothetical protein
MREYFDQPELATSAIFVNSEVPWYRAADLVRDHRASCFRFHAQGDRMVMKPSDPIEPEKIELARDRQKIVNRTAVVVRVNEIKVAATMLLLRKPSQMTSIIALKSLCTRFLPRCTVTDTITFQDDGPVTSPIEWSISD